MVMNDNPKLALKVVAPAVWISEEPRQWKGHIDIMIEETFIKGSLTDGCLPQQPVRYKRLFMSPCPFCGGEGSLYVGYNITCSECFSVGARAETIEEAVAKWNHRIINAETAER